MSPLLRDSDIRAAARTQFLRQDIDCPDTIVIDELGIRHGAARVDIAVIGNYIRGIEIKSAADNVKRLQRQASFYSEIVDVASVVIDKKFIKCALQIVPSWWGIQLAIRNSFSGVDFIEIRREERNPGANPFWLAHLLWKSEALKILFDRGYQADIARLSRSKLYEILCDSVSYPDLNLIVRQTLKSREKWRDHAPP